MPDSVIRTIQPEEDSLGRIIASSTAIGRAAAIDDVITLIGDLSKVRTIDPDFLNALFSGLSTLLSGAPHDHPR